MGLNKSKITNLHRGDAFLVKPLLEARRIDPSSLYSKYTKGKNRWYGREHLNKIINGKRPIPIALAQDIAKDYDFKWTEFYEVDENRVKTVDAVIDKNVDFMVNFKPSGEQFYCCAEYIDSHWAVYNLHEYPTYFGNITKGVFLYSKQPHEVLTSTIKDTLSHPVLLKTKRKEYYEGMLTGYSTPVGNTEPNLYLADLNNSRYSSFRKSEVQAIHYCDMILPRPQFLLS